LLYNQASQYGKPAGAFVGTVEFECTVASASRSLCDGVAHAPDGFLAFAGANLLNGGATSWYGVTGGVGAYARDRGEIQVTNIGGPNSNRATEVVTLYT
jgi:hypothetical protein